MHTSYVYVIGMDGVPLMPTKRYGWVRRSLKSGKAKVVKRLPFTIQLMYEPVTRVKQDVVFGIDPGRVNIGLSAVREDGTCLYNAQCCTRNKEIPRLMEKRKAYRQASRRGERKRRQRRAKRCHTMFEAGVKMRHLNGYGEDGYITLKGIRNTEAKFSNRKRPEGWITPTARQLIQTHENLIRQVMQFLPIKQIVLEINRFAFIELDNPELKPWEVNYQQGPLFGKTSVEQAVAEQQNYHCLLCKRGIDDFHHIQPVHLGGSNTIANRAGLCKIHHRLAHTDEKTAAKIQSKRSALNKKYGSLSVLNQIIPFLAGSLSKNYPNRVAFTTGYLTKEFRDRYGLVKDHDRDAYCIACSWLKADIIVSLPEVGDYYQIQQFRNHNRANIHSQRERTYYLDGKKVATNHRKRTEQKTDSLHEWYLEAKQTYGKQVARQMQSRLTVKPSVRRYNDQTRNLPGTIFFVKGKRYVMQGQLTNGAYVYTTEGASHRFRTKDCAFEPQRGLVYIS